MNDPNDPASLSASAVRAIHEDRAGVLWVGTGDGLNRFDRETETFTRAHFDPSNPESPSGDSNDLMFPEDSEAVIYEDGAGTLWMGTRGLNRYDPATDSFTHFRHDPHDSTSIGRGWVTTMLG